MGYFPRTLGSPNSPDADGHLLGWVVGLAHSPWKRRAWAPSKSWKPEALFSHRLKQKHMWAEISKPNLISTNCFKGNRKCKWLIILSLPYWSKRLGILCITEMVIVQLLFLVYKTHQQFFLHNFLMYHSTNVKGKYNWKWIDKWQI